MSSQDLQHDGDESSGKSRPVAGSQRILAIDVLRGFALLGILLLNIQTFALPSAAYMNPTAFGDLSGGNYAVWWASHVLGDQKFMTIFSMLFGAGIVMMTQRSEQATGRSAAVHYRRMGWLALFGLLHAHLLWYGDILYSYGMCGLILWPVRKWPAAVLIPLGLFLISIGSGLNILSGWSMQFWPEEVIDEFRLEWQPGEEKLQAEVAAYRGSWWDQVPYRSPAAFSFQTFLFFFWTIWRAGGLMLVGMGLYRLGFYSAKWSRGLYAAIAVVGLAVGVSLSAYGIHWNTERNWAVEVSFFYGSQWNYWGSLLTSLAFSSIVILLCSTGIVERLGALAAVGRMALTNYLMQTILCVGIFYGFGLGLFGSLDRLELLGVVALVWLFQLIVSPLWLSKFRYGPMEWLWRSLTYWKRQPMKISQKTPVLQAERSTMNE